MALSAILFFALLLPILISAQVFEVDPSCCGDNPLGGLYQCSTIGKDPRCMCPETFRKELQECWKGELKHPRKRNAAGEAIQYTDMFAASAICCALDEYVGYIKGCKKSGKDLTCMCPNDARDHLSHCLKPASDDCDNDEVTEPADCSKGCLDKQKICRKLNEKWADSGKEFMCTDTQPWGINIVRKTGSQFVPVCKKRGKDILFVLDASGSIGADDFEKQKDFTAILTEHFTVGKDASKGEYQFGAITFSDVVKMEFDIGEAVNGRDYDALKAIEYTGGSTYTHSAFNYVIDNNLFSKGRPDAEDVVIFLTDGISNNPSETNLTAKRIRDSNVEIISVGVGNADVKELNEVAGNPKNVFHIKDFDALKKIVEKVSYRICTGTTL